MHNEFDIYDHYCGWCASIGVTPAAFDTWRQICWAQRYQQWN